MRYQELEPYLSSVELEAIETLEGCGWMILTETKIEDTYKKDGSRIRTFTLSGRYDIALVLEKVNTDRPMAEPEEIISKDEIIEEIELETESEDESYSDNFWMDESNWKRMARGPFYDLVKYEALDDLKQVPDSVKDEIQRKFVKYFDPDDWPL